MSLVKRRIQKLLTHNNSFAQQTDEKTIYTI